MTPCVPVSWVIVDSYSSTLRPPSAVIARLRKTCHVVMGLLPGRMGHLFEPKAKDYVHRAIVQAIMDAKVEAAGPCSSPQPKETPQDLIEMLTGYKQVPQIFPGPGQLSHECLSDLPVTFRLHCHRQSAAMLCVRYCS